MIYEVRGYTDWTEIYKSFFIGNGNTLLVQHESVRKENNKTIVLEENCLNGLWDNGRGVRLSVILRSYYHFGIIIIMIMTIITMWFYHYYYGYHHHHHYDRNVSFKSNNNNNEKKMYNISSRIMSGEQWGKRRGRTTIANVGDTGNALHLQMRRKSLYFFSVHFRF